MRDTSGIPGSGRLCPVRHGRDTACPMPKRDVSQLRDLRQREGCILSLCGDTLSPYGYTSMLLLEGRRVGREPYLDCVSGNRNDSAALYPPAVWAAPDGIALRPRVSGAPRAVLFGCPLRAHSNSNRLLCWLRPVLSLGRTGQADLRATLLPAAPVMRQVYTRNISLSSTTCGGPGRARNAPGRLAPAHLTQRG